MRSWRGWIAAGAAAFLCVLIVRLPASWAGGVLPQGLTCRRLGGTLWRGTCLDLQVARTPIGDVRWRVHPLHLLTGRLSLSVSLTRAQGRARARLLIALSGAITARHVTATFSLNRAIFGPLPAGLNGRLAAHLALLSYASQRITAIRGWLEARDLSLAGGQPLGSYRVTFPGGAPAHPRGRLADLGGPFAVTGTIRLTRGPGYVVDGRIAARPTAAPELAAQLRFLGAPNPQGQRRFSLAGTL